GRYAFLDAARSDAVRIHIRRQESVDYMDDAVCRFQIGLYDARRAHRKAVTRSRDAQGASFQSSHGRSVTQILRVRLAHHNVVQKDSPKFVRVLTLLHRIDSSLTRLNGVIRWSKNRIRAGTGERLAQARRVNEGDKSREPPLLPKHIVEAARCDRLLCGYRIEIRSQRVGGRLCITLLNATGH